MTESPRISVVIPVLNSAALLRRCLTALAASHGVNWECIVVDDGSTDDSALVARAFGATVLHTGRRASGPAHARNLGTLSARSELVCFLDSDVVPTPDTLRQFVAMFESAPEVDAVFGSYDDKPGSPDFFSQYRNLLHHFVHQHGSERATTFWSGCGTVRRSVFLKVGGFDADSYPRPSIEDIELGVRMTEAGHQIRLAKHIQVKHLKKWGLRSIVRTDVGDRAVPWTRLIVRTGKLPNDLNVGLQHRLSALAVLALGLLLIGALMQPVVLGLVLLPVATLLVANRTLYSLFVRHGGARFACGAVAMHWLYFAYSTVAFSYGSLTSLPLNLGASERLIHQTGGTLVDGGHAHGRPHSWLGPWEFGRKAHGRNRKAAELRSMDGLEARPRSGVPDVEPSF